jgi:hypothetical protein
MYGDADVDQTIVDLDPENEVSQKLRRRLLLRRFWQSAAGFCEARTLARLGC